MKTTELPFHFRSTPVHQFHQFLELSRAVEPGAQTAQAFNLMWMKLNGALKRNRSRWCSEIWEYKNQICKGTCTTFLVSDGFFGSATQKGSKILGRKVLLEKFVRLILGQKVVEFSIFASVPICPANPRRGCDVMSIEFPGRLDLRGSLHPQIAKLPELRHLFLDDSNVSGSLDLLTNNTELGWLNLCNTRVGGDLEALPFKAKGLVTLDLSGTKVTGDLAALANATELLRYLRLSNTAVLGDLKSLAKLESLQELELRNLKVVGDAAVMAEWPYIQHVDLSGTQVEFVRTDFLQQFQPFNHTAWDWKCPWPELRFLDVSRTSQFSLARDLLRPLAGCKNLATLKAAGCGLTGRLWPEIVNKWGRIIPMNLWPLSQALSVLDLASNNVTDVAKLPGSCRTLVLTGNPDVSFGPGVLEKAIKDIVFVDLRNATFGNPSDPLLLIGQLAVITHVLRSIVVAAVTSCAESRFATRFISEFEIHRLFLARIEKSMCSSVEIICPKYF